MPVTLGSVHAALIEPEKSTCVESTIVAPPVTANRTHDPNAGLPSESSTGVLMFTSKATDYMENLPFLIKLSLLVCAALNMLVFHLVTQRSVANWDRDTPTPLGAKVAGALSLMFWIGVVGFGRWIGFTVGGAFS